MVFPLVIAAGAGTYTAGRLGALYRFPGRLSYPLYLVHYLFIYIFTHWINAMNPTLAQALPMMAALPVFFLALTWVALRFYDEPVRAWLSVRAHRRAAPVPAAP